MGILDILIDELNKQPGMEGKFKRMYSQPEKITDIKGVGRIYRPVTNYRKGNAARPETKEDSQ